MTHNVDAVTPRHKLPLLHVGQAQKEVFHNEALFLLDNLIAPVVQDVRNDPSTLSPQSGQSWLVGTAPTGDWAARDNNIASWSASGWIFTEPKAGTLVMDIHTGCFRIFQGGGWFVSNALSQVSGGTTVDNEARAAIHIIIELLRNFRFLPDTAP